ncbi:putative bifunctional diguanylate cyclase/phosphodiesterase [Pengzhenrongella frigida]|uniref:EAL domain-containing protein n=1 Tax=Pengzhenrongella frigida TaxID=1259133 RepID=A0A4Q5MW97_9MICO|nr:EAL domain-containing protein [Cellulomonas sp. HLT2-17]RYV49815.1 EAL domain-containing protein [Cellulomonas sp. HLT2-17]
MLTPVNGLLLALTAVATALFLGPLRGMSALPSTLAVPWWTVAIGFVLSGAFVIHVPLSSSAYTHTLRELPSVIALVFLSPSTYLWSSLLGSGIALLVVQRQRGSKLVFNMCLFAVEVSVAALIFRVILGSGDPTSPRGWLGALAAMLAAGLLSCGLVTLVIFLSGGGYSPEILREAIRSGLLACTANCGLALLVVVLLVSEPLALVLLGVVVAVLFLSNRGYVAFAARYAQLELLYRFVGTVGASLDLGRTVATVLGEARELLGAARAELYVPADGDRPAQHVVLTADGGLENLSGSADSPPPDVWWTASSVGRGVLIAAGQDRTRTRLPEPLTDAMAVQVSIDGIVGVLIVADRLFAGKTFTPQDLRLFEALAGHAASTLQNARLVDLIRAEAAERDHEARHDPLTGLPNRREFQAQFEARAAGRGGAVVMVDLDDFKEINDTLGHGAGDDVLREIGRRLASTADGVVARLGGDEFAVLLPDVDRVAALAFAEEYLEAIRRPVALDDVFLAVGASIGIALYPLHGATGDALLTHADVAMYAAKVAGTRVEVYAPEPENGRHRRLVLAAQMESAIADGAITLWYQPKCDARTGKPVGVEALVRWIHPIYGLVSPAEILPVAERTGLMRRLTDHLVETALRQQAAWRADGLDLTVAVNITARDLLDERLPSIVQNLLTVTGGLPDRLTLEITESGIMRDLDRCLTVLDGLAAVGVKLSIDDFGTGYSSLAYLERLPVSEVKIDQSFVRRLADPGHNTTVLQSTIQMSHALGLSVVAEGVETAPVLVALTALGVDIIQGYHLAYPMPAVEIAPWGLSADRALPRTLPAGAAPLSA